MNNEFYEIEFTLTLTQVPEAPSGSNPITLESLNLVREGYILVQGTTEVPSGYSDNLQFTPEGVFIPSHFAISALAGGIIGGAINHWINYKKNNQIKNLEGEAARLKKLHQTAMSQQREDMLSITASIATYYPTWISQNFEEGGEGLSGFSANYFEQLIIGEDYNDDYPVIMPYIDMIEKQIRDKPTMNTFLEQVDPTTYPKFTEFYSKYLQQQSN